MNPGDTILKKYRIEKLLGKGAFAEVYLVTHLELQSRRAIKLLRRDTDGLGSTVYSDFDGRFLLEARLGNLIDSPYVVRVYDFEREGETLLLVMEYCPGGSLNDRVFKLRQAGEVMSVDEALQLGSQLAEGLAALHAQDAVHRDLKPNNILFDAQGRAKLADLGLAQIPGGPSLRSQLSQPGPHPGTPGFMSPEQETSPNYLRPSSDVYALGLVLFWTLSGRSYTNLKPGTRLSSQRKDIPVWLDDILVRLLAKNPEDRPFDGGEAGDLLRQGLAEVERLRLEDEALQLAEEKKQADEEWIAAQAAQRRADEDARHKAEAELARQAAAEAEVRRLAQLEADRQAELEHQAEQERQTEEMRIANEATEKERKAQLEADHQAELERQKREAEETRQKAQAQLERQRKDEEDRKARQLAEEQRLAKLAAEKERQAEMERQKKANQTGQTPDTNTNISRPEDGNQTGSRNIGWFVVAGVMLLLFGCWLVGKIPAVAVMFNPKPAQVALNVGMVTDVGVINDHSYNEFTWAGIQKASSELGFEANYIESAQAQDYEKNIDQMIAAGANVIIAPSWLMGDALAAKALQYPQVKFAIVDNEYFPTSGSSSCPDTVTDCYQDGGLSNVTSLMFREDQAGFLAGVVAAGLTQTGVVCSVAGIEIPPIVRYVEGYQNGALWARSDLQTLNVYIPSFIDHEKGTLEAGLLIARGCDVLFGVGGTTAVGALSTAKNSNLPGIGMDIDQYFTAPEISPALATSAVKKIDLAVYKYLVAVAGGTVRAGVMTFGVQEDGVDLAPFHDWDSKISTDLRLKIAEAIQSLKTGKISTGYTP